MTLRSAVRASFLTLAGVACQPSGEPPATTSTRTDDAAALRETMQQIAERWNAGDLEGTLVFMTDQFMQMPPGVPARVGLDTNVANWRNFLAENANQWEPLVTEVEVIGELGFVRGTATETTTPRAGGETTVTEKRRTLDL